MRPTFGGGGPSNTPWWLPLVLMGGGKIASTIGGRRDVNARNEDTARLDAEQKRRAQARAAILSSILKSQGYEGLIDEQTLTDLYTRSGARESMPSIFNTIGSSASTIGAGLITRNNERTDNKSTSFWDELERSMAGSGVLGRPS